MLDIWGIAVSKRLMVLCLESYNIGGRYLEIYSIWYLVYLMMRK